LCGRTSSLSHCTAPSAPWHVWCATRIWNQVGEDEVFPAVSRYNRVWQSRPWRRVTPSERRHANLVPDRIRRSVGGRAVAALGLRRTAEAGGREDGPGETRADAPGDGAGARSLHPAGGCREGSALEQPGTFLWGGSRGHAADPC